MLGLEKREANDTEPSGSQLASNAGRIHTRTLIWIFVAQGFVLAPIFYFVATWLILVWLFSFSWRFVIQVRSLGMPPSWMKTGVSVVCLAVLFATSPALFSMDTFIGFFALAFSLKLVEVHKNKDALIVISIAFIAIAAGFLYSQHIGVALYFGLCLVVLLFAWRTVFERRRKSVILRLSVSFIYFVQIVPLMMILFVAMPRLGQLWHMPSPSSKASTGFSESMSPGEFNELIESDAVAFRVSFGNNDYPRAQDRYWRGLVLENYNGVTWVKNDTWLSPLTDVETASEPHSDWTIAPKPNSVSQKKYTYSVLLEPHRKPWLFALTLPLNVSSSSLNTGFTATANVRTDKKVISRSEYTVTSALNYGFSLSSLSSRVRDINLALPREGNTQGRLKAMGLRNQYGIGVDADKAILNEILAFYAGSFTYTLRPPRLEKNHIDEFLFSTQRGFCEHFSSSFVFLARAAGIPARVVVGYQGGELSSSGEYMIVRQRDAHAWAEAWLEGEGWIRYDPTAAVSPLRIERGLSNALPNEEQSLVGGRMSSISALNWLQMRFDSASYSWHRFVLNYDDDAQRNFFNHVMGGAESWRIALFFIAACGTCLLFYFAHRLWPQKRRFRYKESSPYALHLASLERLGCMKNPHETPAQFAQRASCHYPIYAKLLQRIAQEYERMAYDPHESSKDQLTTLCRLFSKHARQHANRVVTPHRS